MTKINLHGLLAFEFGDSFELFLMKPKDVLHAIDANKKNFYKRIIELSQQGSHYSIIIDGSDIKDIQEFEIKKQAKVIDLVPVIVGSGGNGGVLAAMGVVALFIPGLQSVGVALIGLGVSMMLAPKQSAGSIEPPKAAIGTASAINQSFYFSNIANLAQQGSPVPIGYGRLRVGSSIIHSSVRSYPIEVSSNTSKAVLSDNEEINNSRAASRIQNRS
jgi:predicted phage tail protein